MYIHFFTRISNFLLSLNILNFSDFEPRIILKLFLNTKGVTLPKTFKENISIFAHALLHQKTEKEPMFCINTAKMLLKAVLLTRIQKCFRFR